MLTARRYCKFVSCSESPVALIYRADAAGFIAPRFIMARLEAEDGVLQAFWNASAED